MSQQTTPLHEVARMLNLGPIKLYHALRARKVLNNNNLPYRCYVVRGLFTSELKQYEHPTLGPKLYATPHVTDAGIQWLAKQFEVEIAKANNQAEGAAHQCLAKTAQPPKNC